MRSAPIDWLALFPARDFRHPMATRRGDLAAYFAPSENHAEILRERNHWLTESPQVYAAAREEDHDIFLEAMATISTQCSLSLPRAKLTPILEDVIECAKLCEADWVVLRKDERVQIALCGGAVCFPSGWALREKVGLPLSSIHEIVPQLNSALQPRIEMFLNSLKPGETFERSNWGLAPDAELNHHPGRNLPRFRENVSLIETWIRLERQLLYRLPQTGAVLFGIHVTVHSLDEVSRIESLATRIAHALRTMPDAVAIYKGVGAARANLIKQLEQPIR